MITFAQAEILKKELTDRYVIVQEGVPELRRFQGKTGQVRTVNMSGRALVQFDGSEDISWYDIDPTYLKIVQAPLAKKTEAKAAPLKENDAPVEKKPSAGKPAGKSPLEMARAQGAAGATKPAAEGGKKLSPLELARQQGAGGAAKAASKSEAPAAASAPQKKLSPLELARQQGAAGTAQTAPVAKTEPAPPAPPASTKPATPAAAGKKLSPLELARQQGAAGSGGAKAAPKAEAAVPSVVEEPPVETVVAAVEEIPAPVAAPAKTSGGGQTKTPGTTAEIIALARQQGAAK